jgi:hypothetical protein
MNLIDTRYVFVGWGRRRRGRPRRRRRDGVETIHPVVWGLTVWVWRWRLGIQHIEGRGWSVHHTWYPLVPGDAD